MKLEFQQASAQYSARSVLEFTKEGMPDFWCDPFFHFFPDVDKAEYQARNNRQRLEFLQTYFDKLLLENVSSFETKIKSYQNHWNQYEHQIIAALEDAFETELSSQFNDLVCLVTMNPVSPRYLAQNTFDTFYLQSERGALGNSIHEIIHFVWFLRWQEHFRDNPAEYESPHLKWILSEMVVDTIMRDHRLSSINSYCSHGGCAYPYFYTTKIEDRLILETLYDMFQNLSISEFMEAAYRYCQKHEADIRKHIAESETKNPSS